MTHYQYQRRHICLQSSCSQCCWQTYRQQWKPSLPDHTHTTRQSDINEINAEKQCFLCVFRPEMLFVSLNHLHIAKLSFPRRVRLLSMLPHRCTKTKTNKNERKKKRSIKKPCHPTAWSGVERAISIRKNRKMHNIGQQRHVHLRVPVTSYKKSQAKIKKLTCAAGSVDLWYPVQYAEIHRHSTDALQNTKTHGHDGKRRSQYITYQMHRNAQPIAKNVVDGIGCDEWTKL